MTVSDGDGTPKATWHAVRDAALEALRQPGVMERTMPGRAGEVPVEMALIPRLSDVLVHTWDLARATGGDERLSPDVAAIVLERLRPNDEILRSTGTFGPRVESPPGRGRRRGAPLLHRSSALMADLSDALAEIVVRARLHRRRDQRRLRATTRRSRGAGSARLRWCAPRPPPRSPRVLRVANEHGVPGHRRAAAAPGCRARASRAPAASSSRSSA